MRIDVSGAARRRRVRRAMAVDRDAWDRALDMTTHGDGTLADAVGALNMPGPLARDYDRKARVRRLDPTITRIFSAKLGLSDAELDALFELAKAGEGVEVDEGNGGGLVVGRWYEPGDQIEHEGVIYEVTRAFLYANAAWTPADLAAHLVAIPDGDEWQVGASYEVGDEVTYEGTRYRCVQAHTAKEGWEPPNTPALWDEQA